MTNDRVQQQIDSIDQKLDIILEEIELQRRHRRAMEDLRDDLTRVGKDLYQSAVVELEQVHDYIQTGDLLYLFKKLLRNIKNITKMFEAVESTQDFLRDFSPVAREMFIDFMKRLDELDGKGYFQFAGEFGRVADKVVTSFTVEDVKNLGDNIVTILNTVKTLTQPDILHVINNAVGVYKKLDIEIEKDITMFSLLRQFNTPEMKRGLAFAIKFLKSVAEQRATPTIATITMEQTN